MSFFAGIDCGTQSTKVIIIDTSTYQIIGEGRAPHSLVSDSNGKREQEPKWWIEALISAFRSAIKVADIDPTQIKGLAVSAQQHGLVALDSKNDVILPAKLWCDTETAEENSEIITAMGGENVVMQELGLMIATGYTASKLLWLQKYQPEKWQRLDSILLPHDYLNFWLTGRKVMEFGDASGTGLFNIQQRCWNERAIRAIDSSGKLASALPQLVNYDEVIGTVRPEIACLLGLNSQVIVTAGGGDNMMGAIGTGNVKQGIMTMSLGTSGTLFAFTEEPISDHSPLIANFCSSSNGWLPLICVMNITSATNLIQQLFKLDLTQFNKFAEEAPIGAKGITVLPFFNGERVPDLPNSRAVFAGLDATNCTVSNLSRAVMEGATFSLRYGLELLKQAKVIPSQIRLTGGGAQNPFWRQMIADVMNCPVVCLEYTESAALGAAIQCAWGAAIYGKSLSEFDKQSELVALCDRFVHFDESTFTSPYPKSVMLYETVYERYLALLNQQYGEKSHAHN